MRHGRGFSEVSLDPERNEDAAAGALAPEASRHSMAAPGPA